MEVLRLLVFRAAFPSAAVRPRCSLRVYKKGKRRLPQYLRIAFRVVTVRDQVPHEYLRSAHGSQRSEGMVVADADAESQQCFFQCMIAGCDYDALITIAQLGVLIS